MVGEVREDGTGEQFEDVMAKTEEISTHRFENLSELQE